MQILNLKFCLCNNRSFDKPTCSQSPVSVDTLLFRPHATSSWLLLVRCKSLGQKRKWKFLRFVSCEAVCHHHDAIFEGTPPAQMHWCTSDQSCLIEQRKHNVYISLKGLVWELLLFYLVSDGERMMHLRLWIRGISQKGFLIPQQTLIIKSICGWDMSHPVAVWSSTVLHLLNSFCTLSPENHEIKLIYKKFWFTASTNINF